MADVVQAALGHLGPPSPIGYVGGLAGGRGNLVEQRVELLGEDADLIALAARAVVDAQPAASELIVAHAEQLAGQPRQPLAHQATPEQAAEQDGRAADAGHGKGRAQDGPLDTLAHNATGKATVGTNVGTYQE